MAQESSQTAYVVAFNGPLGQDLKATYLTATTPAASIAKLATTSTAPIAQAAAIPATTSTTVSSAVTRITSSAIPTIQKTAINVTEAYSTTDISKLGRDLGKRLIDNLAGDSHLAKLAGVLIAAGGAVAFHKRATIYRFFRRMVDRVGLQRLLSHPEEHRQEIQEELLRVNQDLAVVELHKKRRAEVDPFDAGNPHEARQPRLDDYGRGGDLDEDLPQAPAEPVEQLDEAGAEVLQQRDEAEVHQQSDASMPDVSDGAETDHQQDEVEVHQEQAEPAQVIQQEEAEASSQQNRSVVASKVAGDDTSLIREFSVHVLWKQIAQTKDNYSSRKDLIAAVREEVLEFYGLDFLANVTAEEAFQEVVRRINEADEQLRARNVSAARLTSEIANNSSEGIQVPSDSPSSPHPAKSSSNGQSRLHQATVEEDEVEEDLTGQSFVTGPVFRQPRTGTPATTFGEAHRTRTRNLSRENGAGDKLHSIHLKRKDPVRHIGLRPSVRADLRQARRALSRPGVILETSAENTPVAAAPRQQVAALPFVATIGSSLTSSSTNNPLTQGQTSQRTSILSGPVTAAPPASSSNNITTVSALQAKSTQPDARSPLAGVNASPASAESSSLSDPPSSPSLSRTTQPGSGFRTPAAASASTPAPVSTGRHPHVDGTIRRLNDTGLNVVPATPLNRRRLHIETTAASHRAPRTGVKRPSDYMK